MTVSICLASSRVGAKIIARLHLLLSTISIKGIQKAAVLPVPVCADPKTSLELRIKGMAFA